MPLCNCPKYKFCIKCRNDYYKLRDNANRIEQSWAEEQRLQDKKQADLDKLDAARWRKLCKLVDGPGWDVQLSKLPNGKYYIDSETKSGSGTSLVDAIDNIK